VSDKPPKFRVGQMACDKLLIGYPRVPEFRRIKKHFPSLDPGRPDEHIYWIEGNAGCYIEGDLVSEDEIVDWAKRLICETEGPYDNRDE
jgi:hypothetical protein